MNDTTVQMIAQAILANTKVIQSLIEALPHDAKTAVAEVVTVAAPAPVAPAPAPVVQAAPVVAPVAPAMPAPPAFVNPAPYVPMDAPTGAPFSDPKGLIDYVMSSYKTLGATKGSQIQGVLVSLGYQNINDVKPEHYGSLFAGIEALK
tara:strand:+ start:367 stop:810 length:444 start_codon:yes stop_codon:yes gene_type:complete